MAIDIKEKITELVNKITKDEALQKQFKENPVKAVESLLGVDLPDEQIQKIVDGVKAKISIDAVSEKLGGLAGLFGKK